MSVRLTVRLRREQECIIDCRFQIEESVSIALELADDVNLGPNLAVLEVDGSGVGKDERKNASVVPNGDCACEADKRGSIVDMGRQAACDGLTGGQYASSGLAALGGQSQFSIAGANSRKTDPAAG